MMFNDLDDLLWWLVEDVVEAYCAKRDRDADDGDGCKGCCLEGCGDCPAEIIDLARRLEWRRG